MVEKIIFEYSLIYLSEIIQSKKGLLNLKRTNNPDNRINAAIETARILLEYLNEIGMYGWEVCSDIEWDRLKYNGGLLIRKRIIVNVEEDVKTIEASETPVNFKENFANGNLYQEFEKETGKHSIWKSKETKLYKEWLNAKKSKVETK